MTLRAALCFFTRLPVKRPVQPLSFQGIVAWLPGVGVIIGILLGLSLWLFSHTFSPGVCGVLGCLVWVAVTGGIHLDGVADCGDGMLVEVPKEKRLDIMKDSRVGTFGAVALFLILMIKASALCELCRHAEQSSTGLLLLISSCAMAAVLGRSAVFPALCLPSARPDGMGNMVGRGVGRRHALAAGLLSLFVVGLNGWTGVVAAGAAAGLAAIFLRAACKRLGGVTGDVFGCLIELTECAVLVTCCVRFPAV